MENRLPLKISDNDDDLGSCLEVPEIVALKLCTIYCDGSTSLVSLQHRVVLADAEDLSVEEKLPHVDLASHLGDDMSEGREHDSHETRACKEAGLDPDEGFPGWKVIFDYLDKHPELLEGTR